MVKLIMDIQDDDIEKIKANYAPTSQYLAMKYMLDAINSGTICDIGNPKYYEMGYNDGIQETNKAFFRILGLAEERLTEIEMDNMFGTHQPYSILGRFSTRHIIDKIREYDKEKEQYILNKGDEVIWTAGENNEYTRTGIVTSVNHFKGVTRYSIIDKNTYDTYDRLIRDGEKQDMYTKTGKRYKINFLDNLEEEEKNNEK